MGDDIHHYTFAGWPEMPWKKSRRYKIKKAIKKIFGPPDHEDLYLGITIWTLFKLAMILDFMAVALRYGQ